jgi:hypothetical protein
VVRRRRDRNARPRATACGMPSTGESIACGTCIVPIGAGGPGCMPPPPTTRR